MASPPSPEAEEKDSGRALSTPTFWDTRYSRAGGDDDDAPTHEWFRSFSALQPFLARRLVAAHAASAGPLILHLGSGDSAIPAALAAAWGYGRQLCVDFSAVVVERMRRRMGDGAGIEWRHGDVRDLRALLRDATVDVAFDKGTLDAMVHGSPWHPPADVRDNCARYLAEVFRVLKPGGRFLYVTYRQKHFVRPLLEMGGAWAGMECEELGGEDGGLGYFGWVLSKAAEE